MGEAGHVRTKFDRVLRGGNYRAAYLLALELDRIELDDALALTVLAAEQAPDEYPKLARRLVARIAAEIRPPLPALAIVTNLLADAGGDGHLPASKLLPPLQRVIAGERVG
jgi:hypothetical protein